VFLLAAYSHGVTNSQDHPNSPVFKDYKPPEPAWIIGRSTATYSLWQTFMLMKRANDGEVLAQHELGVRYLTGKGFSPDTVKAAYWIQKAAEQNLIPARYNLGILSYNGWGVPWNPFESYRDFVYCANQNMVEAQYVLGQFLTDGLVVPRNNAEAYRWVKKAADAAYEPAKEILKKLEREIAATASDTTGHESHAAPVAANGSFDLVFFDFENDSVSQQDDLNLLSEALQSSSTEEKEALGVAHLLEGELTVDSISLEAIRQSAEAGSPEALTVSGRCYDKGIVVKSDMILATVYYLRAARLGFERAFELLLEKVQHTDYFPKLKSRAAISNPDAQYAWATLYALGFDYLLADAQSRLTDAQALHLLEKAARRNHVPAIIELGLLYYGGRWVGEDRARAIAHWEQASELGSPEGGVRIAMTTVRESNDAEELNSALTVLGSADAEGSVLAQVALAYCYETGTGVPQSEGKAAMLYRKGAYRGSQDAYYALKRMHDEIRPDDPEFRMPD
jgi:TPR repeat protein